jgi:hypothetical protein
MKLTTYVYVAPRFRISGIIILLRVHSSPISIFMECNRKSSFSCRLCLHCVVVVVLFSTVDKFHVYIVGIRHYITFHYTLVLFCVSYYRLPLFVVNISNFNIRQIHCNLSAIISASYRQFVLRHYMRTLGYTIVNSTLIPLNKCLHTPGIFSL